MSASRCSLEPKPASPTAVGSSREFSSPDAGGVYQTVSPSDEYRTLQSVVKGCSSL